MKEVRVGIIGAGVISHRHMTIYKKIPNVKVVAVCEIDTNKLQSWSEKYGITETYTDYREFLKRDDMDAVDVCVHNNLHVPMAIAVMRAGFHCYCEKPMAGSYADAKLLYDAAAKYNKKLAVQISSIYNAQTRIARSMIQNGELGKVYHIRTAGGRRRGRPGLDMPALTKDFFSKEVGGHGPVFDTGVYRISQMLFLMGIPELESVYGSAYQEIECDERLLQGKKFEVEELGVGMAKYKGGLSMEIMEAWAMNLDTVGDSYILGSKGGLKVTNVDCYGGPMSIDGPMPPWIRLPGLTYYGDVNGRQVEMDLAPNDNEKTELAADPVARLYNDNQLHWIAYLTGELNDDTRYDTPWLALNTMLVSEGLFLSNQLGRSVTADEIREMSQSTAIRHQKTEWGQLDYEF